jgi:hypothetical protein
MLSILGVACALALSLSSTAANAQDTAHLQIQTDGSGFVSFSNFSIGRRRDMPELTFEVSIVNQPLCSNLVIYYDLLSPSGEYIVQRKGAAGTVDELRNIRYGRTYVAHIVQRNLDSAGSILMWPECSIIR